MATRLPRRLAPITAMLLGLVVTAVMAVCMPTAARAADLGLMVDYDHDIVCGEPVTFTLTPTGATGNPNDLIEYRGKTNQQRVRYYRNEVAVLLDGVYQLENDPTKAIKEGGSVETSAYQDANTFTYTFVCSGTYKLGFEALDFGSLPLGHARTVVYVTVSDPAAPSVEQLATNLANECLAQGFSTDYEKALWVHDRIAARATYDTPESYMGPSGVLARGKGTCESYHRAYAMVLGRLGIPCERSEGNGHVWSSVKLDGEWTQVDLTWDDDANLLAGYEYMSHIFFGLTDDQMALVHSDWAANKSAARPCTSTQSNYFLRSGQIARWTDPLKAQIDSQLAAAKASAGEKNVPSQQSLSLDCEASPYPNSYKVIYPLVAQELGRLSYPGWQVSAAFNQESRQFDVVATPVAAGVDPMPAVTTPADGWLKTPEGWRLHKSGEALSGWQKTGSAWYWLDSDTKLMATGWKKLGSTWYWFEPSGKMVTGWRQVKGSWYYFASSGAMKTGWLKQGATWYWLSPSGAMKTGWAQIGGKWYWFNQSGAMQTGWQKISGKWYYFYSSGAMR